MNPAQVSANEKKSRLSRLLGKRDKTPERPTSLPDSAYASSETPSGADFAKERGREMENNRLSSVMVPADKDSEIGNIDRGKNLALKPSTGEVFDQDTGEVVTVVTTTTTTTTTTTRRPGQGPPEINNDVKREIQQAPPIVTTAASSGGMSEMPANTTSIAQSPVQNTITAPQQSGSLNPIYAQTNQSPPIPTKSPNRRSIEVVPDAAIKATNQDYVPGSYRPASPPGSPSRHNFSYPSRAAPGVGTAQPGLTTTDSTTSQNSSYPLRTAPGVGTTQPGLTTMDSVSSQNSSYPLRTTPGVGTAHPGLTTMNSVSSQNSNYPWRAASGFGTTQSGLTTTNSGMSQNRGTTLADLKAAAKGLHGVGETLRGTLNSNIDRRFPSKDAEKAAQINARNDMVLAKGRTEMEGIPHHRINDVREATTSGAWPEQVPETGTQSIANTTTIPENRETSTIRSDSREREKARSISKLFKRKPLAGEKEDLRVTNP